MRRMTWHTHTRIRQVGRHVNQVVAARFGKAILELGGNNALIVDASADLDLAVRAVLFGCVVCARGVSIGGLGGWLCEWLRPASYALAHPPCPLLTS